MNNFIRITVIVLTALLGIVNSSGYIFREIMIVSTRENMEGYFNVPGIIYVILALILIVTNIPSFICQIKIMSFNKRLASSGILDEDHSDKEYQAWKKLPSLFLRKANLIFSIAILINFTMTLVHGFFLETFSDSVFFIVIAILLMTCGMLMTVDALKVRRQARELTEKRVDT